MDSLHPEPDPAGRPTTQQDLARHRAYVAIPTILLALDVLGGISSSTGGCAGLGQAWQLVAFNMAITFLTWLGCCVDLARGQRSSLLSLGTFLNSAWVVPILIGLAIAAR